MLGKLQEQNNQVFEHETFCETESSPPEQKLSQSELQARYIEQQRRMQCHRLWGDTRSILSLLTTCYPTIIEIQSA